MPRLMIEGSIPYMRDLKALELFDEVQYIHNAELKNEHLSQTDAMIVRSITRCNAELLQDTPVQFIATATAGFDHISTDYCQEHNITWTTAKGCNATAVAQYVWAALSHLSIKDDWQFADKTIGIIGVGCVGKEVERIARAVGMNVLLNDPIRAEHEGVEAFVSLEEIQAKADIITLHVPLTKEGNYPTYHLVDDDFLKACQKPIILINACRGAVTDSSALITAKDNKSISRLVIDCWEHEPNINQDLVALAELVSPHIAGFSAEGKFRGARMSLDAILKHFGLTAEGVYDTSSVLGEVPDKCIKLDNEDKHYYAKALLHTLDPLKIDGLLRQAPQSFEAIRKGYIYPREMEAYIVEGATAEQVQVLKKIGFQ